MKTESIDESKQGALPAIDQVAALRVALVGYGEVGGIFGAALSRGRRARSIRVRRADIRRVVGCSRA